MQRAPAIRPVSRIISVSILALIFVLSCSPTDAAFISPIPFESPISRELPARPQPRVYIPVAMDQSNRRADVWRDWPHHKSGVAGASLFLSEASVKAGRALPILAGAYWGVSYNQMKWSAANGVIYYPRLSMKATFQRPGAPDLDGVVDEAPDLVKCEPLYSQEAEVKRIAQEFTGAQWDMFNEPDNLDLLAGDGCIDRTVGGPGYRGFGNDPAVTGPRHAYWQAAAVVRYWVDFVRAVDPTARFTCCGELNGPSAEYVRGVADAYRELYGQRIPLDAVSLHIYQVDNWDLGSYKRLLQTAIANVDSHPDLRGLPLSVNEGILLTQTLDPVSRERSAWLMYHWFDWLNLPENNRVRFMAWWVDGLCSNQPNLEPDWEYCQKQWEIRSGTVLWPGDRLFDDKRLERQMLTPAGEVWRRYWCNWMNDQLDPVPRPCDVEWILK